MKAMTHDTAIVGTTGEDAAARYLEEVGYRIIERNVRFGRYEIDIVAEDRLRGMIVFVEVKTRTTSNARYPLRTAVTMRKRRALRKAAARWVAANEYEGAGRTDVIGVAGTSVVEHVLNLGSDGLFL